MIDRVEYKGKVMALIMRRGIEPEGVNFYTSADNSLQLGVIRHKQGFKVKPHIHKRSTRTIEYTQEVLHIEYGCVEVEFYDDNGTKIGAEILNANDTILQISGGHGFNMLEDSQIIEVKQGPYRGVEDDKQIVEVNNDTSL